MGLLPESSRGYLEVQTDTLLNPSTSLCSLRERNGEGPEEETQAALLGSRGPVMCYAPLTGRCPDRIHSGGYGKDPDHGT